MRRCGIGVLCELVHEWTRQKALEQLEWSAVRRQALLLVSKAWHRYIDGVQVARPFILLLCWCSRLLLLFILLAAVVCREIHFCVRLLIVAVPAALQRQAERGGHIALLELREGRGGLLLRE